MREKLGLLLKGVVRPLIPSRKERKDGRSRKESRRLERVGFYLNRPMPLFPGEREDRLKKKKKNRRGLVLKPVLDLRRKGEWKKKRLCRWKSAS